MSQINERLVAIGGGTGMPRLLENLKEILSEITAVVTVTDDGGDGGRHRNDRAVSALGDAVRAIFALADERIMQTWGPLFSYQFAPRNSCIDLMKFRNLLLMAEIEMNDDNLAKGIQSLSRKMQITGKVLPVSQSYSNLYAYLSDNSILQGEGAIDTRSPEDERTITNVFIQPEIRIYGPTANAIAKGKKIVFPMGDLYTSVIPPILTTGFKEAIEQAVAKKAKLIYVVNLMTKKAETADYKASDFARILLEHLDRDSFDHIIVNTSSISANILKKYEDEGAEPVEYDLVHLKNHCKRGGIRTGCFVDEVGDRVRHNSLVAQVIADL